MCPTKHEKHHSPQESREIERNVPPLMRESVGFWLACGHGRGGGASASMEQGVCELACQNMALCVCR